MQQAHAFNLNFHRKAPKYDLPEGFSINRPLSAQFLLQRDHPLQEKLLDIE
ncbi:MAG: hypothetical protein L3J15_03095 [Devosiaceae bacterium]|nr:hypothetical protein [Devosiaceae bacterium]